MASLIDKDKSGYISREELQRGLDQMLRAYGLVLSRPDVRRHGLPPVVWAIPFLIRVTSLCWLQVERIFQAFDVNADGKVSYDEFLLGVRGPMNEHRRALVKLAFDQFDTDGNGVVTLEEVSSTGH